MEARGCTTQARLDHAAGDGIAMTPRSLRIVILIGFVVLAARRDSFACSCGITNPCQAAGYADSIFSGTVSSVEMVADSNPQEFVVRINVDQAFVNAPRPTAILIMDVSSCTYSFKVGQPYLVYADNKSGKLTTSSCSRTRPLNEATEDLRYLSTMSRAANLGRISGRITEERRNPAEDRFVDYGPVEGVPVSVRGASFVRNGVTGTDGRYEITNLPAGKTTLSILFPFGFRPESFDKEVDLSDAKACRQFDFSIRPVASASGLVVDASGHPLAGVSIDAVAAELAGFDPLRHQYPPKTDEHGVFEFSDLPPGSYVFGVNLAKERYDQPRRGVSIFLPGTSVASEATVFELKAGDRKDLGTLRLTGR
jgi:hypothetical protein